MDGNLVIDNWTRQRRGEDFFGCASVEEKGIYDLKAGVKHDIYVEFCNVRSPADGDEDEAVMDRYAFLAIRVAQRADSLLVTLESDLAGLRSRILIN